MDCLPEVARGVAGQDGPISFSTEQDGPTFSFVNLGHPVQFGGGKIRPF